MKAIRCNVLRRLPPHTFLQSTVGSVVELVLYSYCVKLYRFIGDLYIMYSTLHNVHIQNKITCLKYLNVSYFTNSFES